MTQIVDFLGSSQTQNKWIVSLQCDNEELLIQKASSCLGKLICKIKGYCMQIWQKISLKTPSNLKTIQITKLKEGHWTKIVTIQHDNFLEKVQPTLLVEEGVNSSSSISASSGTHSGKENCTHATQISNPYPIAYPSYSATDYLATDAEPLLWPLTISCHDLAQQFIHDKCAKDLASFLNEMKEKLQPADSNISKTFYRGIDGQQAKDNLNNHWTIDMLAETLKSLGPGIYFADTLNSAKGFASGKDPKIITIELHKEFSIACAKSRLSDFFKWNMQDSQKKNIYEKYSNDFVSYLQENAKLQNMTDEDIKYVKGYISVWLKNEIILWCYSQLEYDAILKPFGNEGFELCVLPTALSKIKIVKTESA